MTALANGRCPEGSRPIAAEREVNEVRQDVASNPERGWRRRPRDDHQLSLLSKRARLLFVGGLESYET